MPNERLRGAMTSAGLTPEAVADRLQVDRKTVERWIGSGRVPHYSHRLAAAALLRRDDTYLWPSTTDAARVRSASAAEVVEVYPSRGSVSSTTWTQLLDGATECVDLLAYAATFLADSVDDVADRLRRLGRAGVRVRLLLGDPDSDAVARRGTEEGIGDLLRSRCELTWKYLSPAIDEPGVEGRRHATTLYASIFRFDDVLLANPHAYGAAASHSPVIHLQRVAGGRIFDHYANSFDQVWASAA